jgi:lipoprotein NlpD
MRGRKRAFAVWCAALVLGLFLSSCASGGVYHRVGRGETLWRIAHTYDVPMDRVIRANHIKDPTEIRAGTRLFIPGARHHMEVVPAETATRKASSGKGRKSSAASRPPRDGFTWPVRGRLLRRFGTKDGIRNDGIDIAAPSNTPVRAARDGEVVYVAESFKTYGKIIILKHDHNIYTVYANNRTNKVKRGKRVKKGEVIARAGKGTYEDVFIHFEVREGKRPVDPLYFLPSD